MTAILSKENDAAPKALRRTFIPRDMRQIADLIQLCFESSLDGSGRAAIREMKLLSRFGPLLWLFALLDYFTLGIALGFVWREGKDLVGNVSIYRAGVHPDLHRGWLIANVAVHPNYRRRGIARQLVQAAMKRIKDFGGHWVALQVEPDNVGAVRLYQQLGFDAFETLTMWEAKDYRRPQFKQGSAVHRRKHHEINAETDLIYRRARRGATAWTRPITPRDIHQPPQTGVGGLRDGRISERWVLPAPDDSGQLLASAWVEAIGLRRARVTLFQEPNLPEEHAITLLSYVLNLRYVRDRHVQLEIDAADKAVESLLQEAGFSEKRKLLLMRKLLSDGTH